MLPKLITFGSFYIPTYGVLVALGFLAALSVTMRLATRSGLPGEKVTNLAVYCAMAGIIGAKLFMFLFDFGDYVRNPGQIFTLETLQAAGVFHGGLIAAIVFAVFYVRRNSLPLFATMDAFAPGIALGQSIGRLGCFAAGCCWGKQCDLPWGVRFRSNFASPVPLDRNLHPVQLYESAADLLIFFFLYRRFGNGDKKGEIIGLYLVLYSIVRFVIEFYREHEQSLIGPFSITQWIALALLVVGVAFLLHSKRSVSLSANRPQSAAA